MRINVSEATIKTATVEIKTMSISGKQVTLAVFRQLIDEPVLAWDADGAATVKGPIWGSINYHPDKSECMALRGEHIHVVWQRGDELRRSAIKPSWLRVPDEQIYVMEGVESDQWVLTYEATTGKRFPWRSRKGGITSHKFFIEDLSVEVVQPQHGGERISSLEEASERFLDLVARKYNARRANRQLADALEALPQLFIAV